jgi:hypothetical protein
MDMDQNLRGAAQSVRRCADEAVEAARTVVLSWSARGLKPVANHM